MSKKKRFRDNKYFKWGLTAFIVIALSMCFHYFIYNSKGFFSNFSSVFKVFKPLVFGLVTAYLLWPIVRFIEVKIFAAYYAKKSKPITAGDKKRFRVISIIFSLIIVGLLIYAFFGSVLPELYKSIENIIVQFPTYYDNVLKWADEILSKQNFLVENNVEEILDSYSDDIGNFIGSTVLPGTKSLLKSLYTYAFGILSTLYNIIIGLIVAIYLLGGKEKFIGQVKKLIYSYIPREKANNLMIDLRFIDKTFGGFLIGKIVDSFIIGVLCFVALTILKMPYAVLISVIVGVTNIIPFFGPWFGAVPSAILILLVDPKKCLVFLIFILILQQLDGNVIGPAILGNSIGVSSFWIIVAITVFGGFWGVFGMLVGVPLLAIAYAFIRRNVNKRLERKHLTIATSEYSTLDIISDDNEMIMLDGGKKDKDNTRYIELNPNEIYTENKASLVTKIRKLIIKLFDAFKRLVARIKKK